MKEKVSKKAVGIEKVISLFLVLMVLLCGTVTVQVVTKGYASFGGHSFFRVVTGSMEPTIPTGALLVCRDIDINDVTLGDIICFHSKDRYMKGSVITHRVHDIRYDNESNVNLITKGDANLTVDGYISSEDNFIGKVVWFTSEDSFFIRIVKVLSSPVGFMACIVFPVLAISSLVLRECTKSIMKDLEEANAELDRAEKSDVEAITVSDEEYQEMYERIKRELIEELGINRDERED